MPRCLVFIARKAPNFGELPMMQARLEPWKVCPELFQALLDLEGKVRNSGIEPSLIALVKIRVSQLNGCAHCLHMHTADARKHGESEMRLHVLAAWQESPAFTPRERAALAWAESLTLIAQTRAPDDVYEQLSRELSEADRVKLSMVIVAINAWNRIAVGFRVVHPLTDGRAAG